MNPFPEEGTDARNLKRLRRELDILYIQIKESQNLPNNFNIIFESDMKVLSDRLKPNFVITQHETAPAQGQSIPHPPTIRLYLLDCFTSSRNIWLWLLPGNWIQLPLAQSANFCFVAYNDKATAMHFELCACVYCCHIHSYIHICCYGEFSKLHNSKWYGARISHHYDLY